MRAGTLDRTITVQTFTETVDDYGTPTQGWAYFATLRAQLVEASTDEFLRGYGESETTVAVFRTRWRDGVTPQMRIVYAGKPLNIREIKEIGRRRGLELRAELVRGEV
jgi:SPP1 family predicted phage head-tail adaptor